VSFANMNIRLGVCEGCTCRSEAISDILVDDAIYYDAKDEIISSSGDILRA